jgi:hypothetical protein
MIRRRLTYARIVSAIALVIAVGGTAVAANLPGTNSVRSSDIKNGHVKRPDLGASAVTGRAIAPRSVDGTALSVFEAVEEAHADSQTDNGLFDEGPILYEGAGFALRGDCRVDGGVTFVRLQALVDPGTAFEYDTFGDATESGSGLGGETELFTISDPAPSSGLATFALTTSAGAQLTGRAMLAQTAAAPQCIFRLHLQDA